MPIRVRHDAGDNVTQLSVEEKWVIAPEIPKLRDVSIVVIFTFMGSWNEALWPLLIVRDQQTMTLPQLLTVFALGGGPARSASHAGVPLRGPTFPLQPRRPMIPSAAVGCKRC